MANRNKQRGDRAERAVRDWAVDNYADSFKTRAGFNDDLGDVIVAHPAGRVVLQVKDVASPSWTEWFRQLQGQVDTCRRESGGLPVVGGVIVHKARGQSDPGSWRAVARLEDLMALLDQVHINGRALGRLDAVEGLQGGYTVD